MTFLGVAAKGRAMSRFRILLTSHAGLTLALLALALAVKALVPAGFMLSASGERILTVTICADAGAMPRQMQIAIPDQADAAGDHPEAADTSQPCAFSGLGLGALGGTDPVLLAGALMFIILLGFAPPSAQPTCTIAFLRPPLRGPPSPGF